ncbi:MAG: hypothetical protein GX567_11225, partial [Clostridia bacterium]|nr:hypothetical protein [Clostridia bacterium]
MMHQLQGIGAVTVNEMHTQLILKKEVRRALHYLEKFSHVHVFFAEKAEHKWNMKTQIFSINRVEMNKGIVLLDEALSDQVDDQEERILLDIKPYFPCEDAVRPEYLKKIVTTTDEYGEQEYPKAFELICTDEASKQFEIEQAGIIRNSHGKTYLQFQETLPDISTNHIKIIWLFNKFEDKRYRRAVECKPPYGDVKKMGIFATRSPVRPNPVAMTIAYVEKVDDEYKRIYISGIESFDKTPFLGVCDYHADYDLIENVSVPEWIEHWPKWFPEPDDAKLQITPDVATDINLDEWLKQNPKTDTVHVLSKLQDVEGTGHSDGIYIQGARENNLKGLTVTIPYTQITAVVGVSGSGKSSLVRDTLYAECKRRMEYLCNDRHLLQKPNVETVSGCIPAVMISQNGLRGNSQSTIGTYTSAYDYLRIIYASIGTRHSTKCNYPLFKLTPSSFSYLDPESRCPVCNGTGYVVTVDEEKLIEHPEKSVLEGASSFWGKLKTFQENSNANWMKGQVFGLAEKKGVDLSLSWNELPEEFREQLLYGTGEEIVKFHYDNKKNGRTGEIERPVEGLCHILERLYEENPTAQSVLKYFSTKKCSECDGERLSQDG